MYTKEEGNAAPAAEQIAVKCAMCNADGVSKTLDVRDVRDRSLTDEYLRIVETDGDVDEYSAPLIRGNARGGEHAKLDRLVAVLEDLAARGMVTRGRNRAVGLIFYVVHPAIIPDSHSRECSTRFITDAGIVGGGLCELLRVLLAPENMGSSTGSIVVGIDMIPDDGRDHATAHPVMTLAEMGNLLDHVRARLSE